MHSCARVYVNFLSCNNSKKVAQITSRFPIGEVSGVCKSLLGIRSYINGVLRTGGASSNQLTSFIKENVSEGSINAHVRITLFPYSFDTSINSLEIFNFDSPHSFTCM